MLDSLVYSLSMRWVVVFLQAVCVAFAQINIDRILDEIAKVEEETRNEKIELLSRSSGDFRDQLKIIQKQLSEIERIKTTLRNYKKRLEKGLEVSLPPVVRESHKVAVTIADLLGEEVEPDIAYAGKEGTVLSFTASGKTVYVYGRVTDRFYPEWGIYIDERTEVLSKEGDGICTYTGGIKFLTLRSVCPLTLTIKGIGGVKTDGEVLYGEVKLGVFDPSFKSKKINELSMFAKIIPEGPGGYTGRWESRFFLYTRPTILIGVREVYIDREKVDFVNELMRMRK